MLNGQNLPLPDGQWDYSLLRFTAFVAADLPDLEALFEAAFGVAPDNEIKARSEMRHTLSANSEGTTRTIESVGPVVHVKIEAEADFSAEEKFFPVIDRDAARPFIGALPRVAAAFAQRMFRMAIGVHYTRGAAARNEAYSVMARFLPGVNVEPEITSDFLYRVNRFTDVEIAGRSIRVNRLASWACKQLQYMVGVVGPSMPTELPKIHDAGHAATLETDINTGVNENLSRLSAEEVSELSKILFSFSEKLAEKGDVP